MSESTYKGGFNMYENFKDIVCKDDASMLISPLDGKEEVFPGVIHPEHYKSIIEPWNAIKVWGLDFDLGNAIKYIQRAGNKDGESKKKDLQKAINYIYHELQYMEE